MFNKIGLVVFLGMAVMYTGGMLIDGESTLFDRLIWLFFLVMTGVFWHMVLEDAKKLEGKDGADKQADD